MRRGLDVSDLFANKSKQQQEAASHKVDIVLIICLSAAGAVNSFSCSLTLSKASINSLILIYFGFVMDSLERLRQWDT